MDSRLQRLKAIYLDMAKWAQDQAAVPRILEAVEPASQLAIVGEALGPSTVRLSGVNYFDRHGRIGPTGTNLDKLLKPLGYTIYPPRNIDVPGGKIDCRPGSGRKTVYCTDLCPTFPGHVLRGRREISRPSPELVRSALQNGFLSRELKIVKPKVVLLLGEHAYISFYRHVLNAAIPEKLSTLINHIEDVELRTYERAVIIPMLHPSPASPIFGQWFKSFPNSPQNRQFMKRVASYLIS